MGCQKLYPNGTKKRKKERERERERKKERKKRRKEGKERKRKKSSGRVPAVFRKPDSHAEVSAERTWAGHQEHLLLQFGLKVTK